MTPRTVSTFEPRAEMRDTTLEALLERRRDMVRWGTAKTADFRQVRLLIMYVAIEGL